MQETDYNVIAALLFSAGVMLLIIAALWFFAKDVREAWRLMRRPDAKEMLTTATERKHAMRVLKKETRKQGKIETIQVDTDLIFEKPMEPQAMPWPPVPLRPVMEEGRRGSLSRRLEPCKKQASPHGGARQYAEYGQKLRLTAI